MRTFLKKILFSFNIGNHKFDSYLWKSYPDRRKVFVRDILQKKLPVGKNRKQILITFGNEPRIYHDGTWSYPIEYDEYGNTKQLLHLYFDGDIVKNAKIKLKKKD